MTNNNQANQTPLPALDQIFAEIVRPAPPFYRAAVQRMVAEYTGDTLASPTTRAALDTFLYHNNKPYALLLAPTGYGKTALLIHWLAHIATSQTHTVIFTSISLRYQTANPRIALRGLAQSLAAFFDDEEHLHIYNMSPSQLRPLISSYLRQDAPAGKQLLVVIDGLDETAGWSIGQDILPHTPGAGIKIVATVRYISENTPHHWLAMLGWDVANACTLQFEGPGQHAITLLQERLCAEIESLSSTTRTCQELARVSQGDPLTMRILARALQEGSLTPQRLALMEPGLPGYIRTWMQELEHQHSNAPVVATLLGLCATAMGNLSKQDLLYLDPATFHEEAIIEQAASTADCFLAGDGSEEDGYVLDHLRLREIFLEHIFSQRERERFRQCFVAYGHEWYRGNHTVLPVYVRRYWIEHLAEVGAWEQMTQVLTEVVPMAQGYHQPWVTARFAAEANYVGYLSDLDILWRWAEQQHQLTIGFRCALIASTLRSISGNLLPELLERLVTVGTPEGIWSISLGFKQVRQMTSPAQKIRAMTILLSIPDQPVPYDLVMEMVQSFADERWRAEALIALADYLPPAYVVAGYALGNAITDVAGRVRTLTALAPHMPADEQPAIYATTFATIQAITHERTRARALTALLPHLPADMLTQGYAAANAITYEKWRTEALIALSLNPSAPQVGEITNAALAIARQFVSKERFPDALKLISHHLAPEDQRELCSSIVDAARAITHAGARAMALVELAPCVPKENRPSLYREALDAAQTIPSLPRRLHVLPTVIPHLPDEEQTPLATDMIYAACTIEDERERAETLSYIARHMTACPDSAACGKAGAVARTISEPRWRALTLASLAANVAPTQRHGLCVESMHAAHSIDDEWQRGEVLIILAPHMTPYLRPRLLDAVRTIRDEWQRAETFVALARHFPLAQQPPIYAEALAACHTIADQWQRSEVICALTAPLGQELQTVAYKEALTAALTFPTPQQQAPALIALLPSLPPTEQQTACKKLFALVEQSEQENGDKKGEKWVSKTLAAMAPVVPATWRSNLVAIAERMPPSWQRVQLLLAVAPHMEPAEQHTLYTDVIETSRSLSEKGWEVAEIIQAAAPHFPASMHAAMVTEACAIAHELHRSKTLAALAPHLSSSLLSQVLASLEAIENEKWRSDAWETIIPHLPVSLMDKALAGVRAIADIDNRARILSLLLPKLPSNKQHALAEEILAAIPQIGYVKWRADALVLLAPHLPLSLLPQALEIAQTVRDAEERTRMLAALAPLRPATLLSRVLDEVDTLEDETLRVDTVCGLAPHLPAGMVPQALETVHTIGDEQYRAAALVRLAPYLSPAQQAAAYAEALGSARAASDEQAMVHTLLELAPNAPTAEQPALYAETFGAIQAIVQEDDDKQLLEQFAQQLANYSRASPANVPAALALWQAAMRLLATEQRPVFLERVHKLVPWLVVLVSPSDLAKIADTLRDIARCWR
jgi:hypothetical protein